MTLILPAIDIIEGECVRLTRGDFNQKSVYHQSPLVIARKYSDHGFSHLHMIDLDGARTGRLQNTRFVRLIREETALNIQFGGGLKTTEDIQSVLDLGAERYIVGSVAVSDPDMTVNWLLKFGPERLVIAADVINEKIAVSGWQKTSDRMLFPFLEYYLSRGLQWFICTDIDRDGTMAGPATDLYQNILSRYPGSGLIASGGIRHIEDVKRLTDMGVAGVIIGKAIYEGTVDLKELSLLC